MSEEITFKCVCGKENIIPARFAGRRGRCGGCKEEIRVPSIHVRSEEIRPDPCTVCGDLTTRACGMCRLCQESYGSPGRARLRMIGAIVLSILGWGGMGFVLWMTMGSGAGHPVMAFPAVATLYGSKAASAYRGAPFWAAAVPCFGIPAAGLPFLFLQ